MIPQALIDRFEAARQKAVRQGLIEDGGAETAEVLEAEVSRSGLSVEDLVEALEILVECDQ